MSYSFTSLYNGGALIRPQIVWQGSRVAVVLDRDGERARIQCTYYSSDYTNLTYRGGAISGLPERIAALVPAYCSLAQGTDRIIRAGGCLNAETMSSAMVLRPARGAPALYTLPVALSRFASRRLDRAVDATERAVTSISQAETDPAWFEQLVTEARSTADETSRKRLLTEVLASRPDLTVEQTLAEVERRLASVR